MMVLGGDLKLILGVKLLMELKSVFLSTTEEVILLSMI